MMARGDTLEAAPALDARLHDRGIVDVPTVYYYYGFCATKTCSALPSVVRDLERVTGHLDEERLVG